MRWCAVLIDRLRLKRQFRCQQQGGESTSVNIDDEMNYVT